MKKREKQPWQLSQPRNKHIFERSFNMLIVSHVYVLTNYF